MQPFITILQLYEERIYVYIYVVIFQFTIQTENSLFREIAGEFHKSLG